MSRIPHDSSAMSKLDEWSDVFPLIASGTSSFTAISYLRGELSGSFSLLSKIISSRDVRSVIVNTSAHYIKTNRQLFLGRRTGHSGSGDISHRTFEKLIASLFYRHWERISIRTTEALARLLVTAIENLLAAMLIVAGAIESAARAIFFPSPAIEIVIKAVMTHRNSREPAYALPAPASISHRRGWR